MKKYIQVIAWILALIVLVLIWKYWYDYYRFERNVTAEEQVKRKIDEYNFEQLIKAKQILSNIWKDDKKFFTLKEFNQKYNANIKPIKNCYYVSNSNWGKPYIFWFQLESDKYKSIYWTGYYAYPKYDLPYSKICYWTKASCHDFTYNIYEHTISNPCED
ncbi:MAG: hypothetical protein ACD_3C00086G0016 [uncultured bacterium (gcode 4)]|uniref:Uncharacterized protein n=1 Tax=uncultured bacterium (gcode 4) TaxID=1234023 RepID=K2G1T4_9BACT|nr:MAG: hypothetical protein ACD_3C00086G0016 [uncultured bacterium (gcode 4)]